MLTYFYVALGGALGSVARYAISGGVGRQLHEVFPWGTLTVNVTGSFLIGLFAAMTAPGGRLAEIPDAKAFLIVGLCGGYTTFSSFSLQTMVLARSGDMARAGANVVVSVILCLVAVWIGTLLGAALAQTRS